MPHNVAVGNIQVGPFEAIQRMFVRGHLPLPLDLAESLEAPVLQVQSSGAFTRSSARNRCRWQASLGYCLAA